MTSLLGSIFREDDSKKETSNETLFARSEALPERPNHKPLTAGRRKRSKEDDKDDNDNDNDNDKDTIQTTESGSDDKNPLESSKQKKRKKKKDKPKEDDKTAAAAAADNDNDQSAAEKPLKEQNGEEERTVFVGNLPLTTTRKSLAALFRDCGPVASCRIRSVPVKGVKLPQNQAGNQHMVKRVCANTNQIDGSLTDTVRGYVVFRTEEAASKALGLNLRLEAGGKKIRVDRAAPTVDPSRSVFVGNLPYGAKEATLQDHFENGCLLEPGDVVGVRIVRDRDTFRCKGFGYVLFREKAIVSQALKLHEKGYMNKKLRVLVCGKRFKGRKGEKPKPKRGEEKPPQSATTVGAFQRIIAKQQKDGLLNTKRKRGEKKKNNGAAIPAKAGAGNVSKRAALDKKVDRKVKKLQKRAAKGMGKNKR